MENQKIKEQIIKANHSKLKFISLIALGFSVFALITDFLVPSVWHNEVLSFYIILDIAFAIISVSAVSFFWLFKIKNINLQNTGIILFPFLVIIWSAFITGIDLTMFGFSTFIIVILLASFFLYLNLIVSILFFVSSGLVIAATVYFIGEKNEHLLSLIFILFPTIVISVLLSALNYKNKFNDLFNQEKMLEMNMKLNDSNENLEKEVEKHTQQIRIALKNTEESEKRFRKSIEFSPIPMAVTNNNGDILFLNKQFVEAFGYSIEELVSIPKWFELAYPDIEYRSSRLTIWGSDVEFAIKNNVPTPVRESFITCKNGVVKTVEISVFIENDISIGLFQDITERKQAEQALLAKVDELERFFKITIGRETNMVALKKEVNNLLNKLGQDNKYTIHE